ncbi:hypothetical protein TNCV_1873721 [Trichonephila clavipes]|nr:hypothetical protein TNCV_1873721 [Trichonephila clavipes]
MIDECTKQLETKLANPHIRQASKSDDTKNKVIDSIKNKSNKSNDDSNKNKKGHPSSPSKQIKKQKVFQNYSIGVTTSVNTNNKYQAPSDALPDKDNEAMPSIHLKFKENYNLVMQEITSIPSRTRSCLGNFEDICILAR